MLTSLRFPANGHDSLSHQIYMFLAIERSLPPLPTASACTVVPCRQSGSHPSTLISGGPNG